MNTQHSEQVQPPQWFDFRVSFPALPAGTFTHLSIVNEALAVKRPLTVY